MYQSKKPYLYGTGRRKSSVARVHLFENGTGSITINGRDIDEYFGLETLKMVVRQPLAATETIGKVDIVATVEGGGVSGQAGALRHGVARALLLVNPDYRPILKKAGFLTRDPRMKERKKYGRTSCASVQQEIISCSNRIKMVQKARKIKVFRAFPISKRSDMVWPDLAKQNPFSPSFLWLNIGQPTKSRAKRGPSG